MKKLSYKIALVIALSSLIPLFAYGAYAVYRSYKTSFELTKSRNQALAGKIGGEIKNYLENTKKILGSLAEILDRKYLSPWQKEEILQNYGINFNEFDSLDLYSFKDSRLISSTPGKSKLSEREKQSLEKTRSGALYISDFFYTENLIPSLIVAYPIKTLGEVSHVLITSLNMLSIWKLIDDLRIGQTGHSMILAADGSICAYGDPFGKALVIENAKFKNTDFLSNLKEKKSFAKIIKNPLGKKVLASGVAIEALGWNVIVEQSTQEAFRNSRSLLTHLSLTALFFIFAATIIGFLGGKNLVTPIKELQRGSEEIAKGNLNYRIRVKGKDEIKDLAVAFNKMGDDLIQYKEEILKKERLATFARLASGLVHDLRHPVQNIRNAYNLITAKPKDKGYFETFKNIMTRELNVMQRFFNDLRDIAHPPPLTIIDLDIHAELNSIIESLKPGLIEKEINVEKNFAQTELRIKADKFVFGRIINNILSNSMKATDKNGKIKISTALDKSAVIEISDNGPGMSKSKLKSIFDEFTTLNKGGLGLGLAVVKKMVSEMGGTIDMKSEESVGTTTRLCFPPST